MRQHKYRAWDSLNKKIYYDSAQTPLLLYGGIIFVENLSFDNVIHINHDLPELIPLQYTGIKDKNDKEIYEGDILSYSRDNQNKINYVKWYAPCFILGQIIMGYCKDFEIIGNIYENPELLEDK